jgi:hypothetical protein
MVKKIILGVLLTAFSGLLIAGAVTRTNDRMSAGTGVQGDGGREQQGRGGEGDRDLFASDGVYGYRGLDREGDQQNGSGDSGPADQRGQRDGAADARRGADSRQGNDQQLVTLEGTVSSADGDSLLVELSSGRQMVFDGREWRFALEQGITLREGDRVKVDGFFRQGEFMLVRIVDMAERMTFRIRNEQGQPLWRGGRGGDQ